MWYRTFTAGASLLLLLLTVVHDTLAEPSRWLHPEITVFQTFAPILWPATDEPIYPTLPHSFAFDGIDSNEDGRIDLEDPDEISWDIRASLSRVVAVLSDFTEEHGKSSLPTRVLYHEPRYFREIDGWHVYVLEYWFYYAYDRGVGGHKGDSEHVFVFVASDKEARNTDFSELTGAKVVGVVGAGHERHTANNVLVSGTNENLKEVIFSRELPPHMPILVERGKHGSAPDLHFNGRFDIGADANVFRDGAWGSRDTRTDSIGRLFGRFKDWYSFPRSERDVILEKHFAEQPFYSQYSDWYPRRFSRANGEENVNGSPLDGNLTYTLFPLLDLRTLYKLLSNPHLTDRQLAIELERFLNEHRDCFWEDREEPVSITLDALRQLRKWPDAQEWEGGDAHHLKLFTHRDHTDPNHIFKLHLYPRFAAGVRYKVDGKSNNLMELSLRFAEIPFFGRTLMRNSMLEVNTSWDLDRRKWYDAELQYWFFRGGYTGLYAGFAVRDEHLRGTDAMSADELAEVQRRLGTPVLSVEASRNRYTAIDFGAALTFNLFRRLIVDAKGGLRTEVFRDRPTDLDITRGAEDKLRFLFSVGFRLGVVNPKHPLEF